MSRSREGSGIGLPVNTPDARGYGEGGRGGDLNSVHELGGYHILDDSGIRLDELQVTLLERGGCDRLSH